MKPSYQAQYRGNDEDNPLKVASTFRSRAAAARTVVCLFLPRPTMVGQNPHKPKKRSRTTRADSSDDENGYLEARTSTLSADRQRNITTVPIGVARVMDRSRTTYIPAQPIEDRPETVPLPQPSRKQRRYKNSVRRSTNLSSQRHTDC